MGIFEREQSELLNYDAAAFWYFAFTILLVITVPWTYVLLKGLLRPRPSPEEDFSRQGPIAKGVEVVSVRRCATAAMEEKQRFVDEYSRSWRFRLRGSIKFQLIGLLILWSVLFRVLWELKDAPEELRKFDPLSILGLEPEAELKDIKKAYRKKSLEHHPDKNPDNPLAPAQFNQVAKAYQALTDPAAIKNYAKYGNPDGEQMKVGVALHPVFVTKENHVFTLSMFFFFILFVPFTVLCCCLRGSRMSQGGVSADTLRVLHACIDEEVVAEDGPSFLAASAEAIKQMCYDVEGIGLLAHAVMELRPTPLASGCVVDVFSAPITRGMEKLPKGVVHVGRGIVRTCKEGKKTCEVEVREIKPGEQNNSEHEVVREFPKDCLVPLEPNAPCSFSDNHIKRNSLLIWSHLWRLHGKMLPSIRRELNGVLKSSVPVVRAMISITTSDGRAVFFRVCQDMIRFRRCLVQALDIKDASPLLQLPHITQSMLTPKILQAAPSFREIVSGRRPEFLAQLKLSKEQLLDVNACCHHMPLVDVSCTVEVDDEDDIAETDVARLTVTLTRTNLKEGELIGPVHAPFFPVPKFEEWWILVYDERDRRVVTVDLVNGTGRTETSKIHFMVPRSGDFRWSVHAMCDSYAGLDVSCPVTFTAKKRKEVEKEIFVHPQDANIKTFFEQLMEEINPERPDEDSESEDEVPLRSAIKSKESNPQQENCPSVANCPGGADEIVPEEKKPVAKKVDDSSDSEDEGQNEALQEPEGSFFEATASTGAFIYRDTCLEESLRVGSVPCGSKLRVFTSADKDTSPIGWAELAGMGGAWIYVGDKQDKDNASEVTVKKLNGLLELNLSTLVQTRTPLMLLKRWAKHAKTEISIEDAITISEIEETRVRLVIEELVRKRIGDKQYEALLDKTEVEIEKRNKRILKARGYFASQNGIIWHVSPQGNVRGVNPSGSKIRDKISVSKEDQIRIGPFALDESRTCSCIHWVRTDDAEHQWVWARDNSVAARVRMSSAW